MVRDDAVLRVLPPESMSYPFVSLASLRLLLTDLARWTHRLGVSSTKTKKVPIFGMAWNAERPAGIARNSIEDGFGGFFLRGFHDLPLFGDVLSAAVFRSRGHRKYPRF